MAAAPVTSCLLVFLMIFLDSRTESKHQQPNLTMTERLDLLFRKPLYDPRLRPHFNEKPVIITVGIWIVAIDAINVMDMDFGLDIFLRQRWTDRGLIMVSVTPCHLATLLFPIYGCPTVTSKTPRTQASMTSPHQI
ncbi:hypothetical protein OS493_024795 [Desmophyllum pertusum]|uniref:Neurotransmitter-gated ion-channel ligand-binding domain-containing protein n=1 Tax=Desmophyllum pertusum TaxID=174260 RepID=A0A9W9ZB61_9CNID|nr:hypothetical protein OS493_024795 [Desmophyllum pertusum]